MLLLGKHPSIFFAPIKYDVRAKRSFHESFNIFCFLLVIWDRTKVIMQQKHE